MWTSFAFLAALALPVGDAGRLAFSNVRTTYGVLGMPRTDTKFLPGDQFVFSFDIEGITVNDSGTVLYSIGVEVTDSKGKVKYRQAPHKLEAHNSLGGNKLPAFAKITIGLDQPEGEYKVKVKVTDLAAKVSKSFTRSYEVLPVRFGLVRFKATADVDGQIPIPYPVEGQVLWASFAAVSFARDKKTGQPDLEAVLRILDEDGKPTLPKPMTGTLNKDVPEKARGVPMQFMLELNQAGKFKAELTCTDKVTGEKFSRSFPLIVLKARGSK
jgi:hypothetical protein